MRLPRRRYAVWAKFVGWKRNEVLEPATLHADTPHGEIIKRFFWRRTAEAYAKHFERTAYQPRLDDAGRVTRVLIETHVEVGP